MPRVLTRGRGLPLAALWNRVGFHSNAVGGLLPFSDASGYYYDARRLLDGHLLGWSARRPLFVGMLATLLGLTGQNLQITLAVFVVGNAVACFLLAREIQISHGTIAGVIVVVLLFLFYWGYGSLGTTLTENLGLTLGMISFAVLWRGAREWRMGVIWIGLGLLTLALCARAGAFFVLPALILGFTPHPVKPCSSPASLREAGRAEQGCKGASKYYLKESPVFQHGVRGLLGFSVDKRGFHFAFWQVVPSR